MKYSDPSGEFWWIVPAIFAGNYAINWLDNTINKGMSAKEAFRQTPIRAGFNYSPSANQVSFPQLDAQKAAKSEEQLVENALKPNTDVWKNYGDAWREASNGGYGFTPADMGSENFHIYMQYSLSYAHHLKAHLRVDELFDFTNAGENPALRAEAFK